MSCNQSQGKRSQSRLSPGRGRDFRTGLPARPSQHEAGAAPQIRAPPPQRRQPRRPVRSQQTAPANARSALAVPAILWRLYFSATSGINNSKGLVRQQAQRSISAARTRVLVLCCRCRVWHDDLHRAPRTGRGVDAQHPASLFGTFPHGGQTEVAFRIDGVVGFEAAAVIGHRQDN
jgi:hypothetical protein